MSGAETTKAVKTLGQVAFDWWATNIGARDSAHARALSARLRRAGTVGILSESAVQDLARRLNVNADNEDRLVRLLRLVPALAEVRDHDGTPLAKLLGGTEPVLSNLRFQRLMRAEGEELVGLMRRAITVADRKCNVGTLASDIWHWGDDVRARWCFHYFGADAPAVIKETTE